MCFAQRGIRVPVYEFQTHLAFLVDGDHGLLQAIDSRGARASGLVQRLQLGTNLPCEVAQGGVQGCGVDFFGHVHQAGFESQLPNAMHTTRQTDNQSDRQTDQTRQTHRIHVPQSLPILHTLGAPGSVTCSSTCLHAVVAATCAEVTEATLSTHAVMAVSTLARRSAAARACVTLADSADNGAMTSVCAQATSAAKNVHHWKSQAQGYAQQTKNVAGSTRSEAHPFFC